MSEDNPAVTASMLDILMSANRLYALRESGQMDAPAQETFDDIAAMASVLFQAPVAQVTFLDDQRQRIPSSLGFEIEEAPVNISFCAFTVTAAEPVTQCLDATRDPRFSDNPYVTAAPNIRFYVGAPIHFRDERVGTLCVYDFQPRAAISQSQLDGLLKLAAEAERLVADMAAKD